LKRRVGETLISHGLPTIDRPIHPARLTGNGVLDLDTRVNLDKVMPSLLVDQELGRTGVSVLNGLGELDGVPQDGLTGLFREMRRGRDLDDLYMGRFMSWGSPVPSVPVFRALTR